MLTPTPTSVSMASGRCVRRDPGAAASAHPAPCPGLSVGAHPGSPAPPAPLPVPVLPGRGTRPGCRPAEDARRLSQPKDNASGGRASHRYRATHPRRPSSSRTFSAHPSFVVAGRCRPFPLPPLPWRCPAERGRGSVPPQDATPRPPAALPLPARPRREEGAGRRDLGGGSERRGRRRMRGRHRRSLRPSRLTAGPTRTKGPVRGRPAPKSSWLPGPGASRNGVGGWKGSAEAPPGCPQPRALLPQNPK